jgi:hypothetical protein
VSRSATNDRLTRIPVTLRKPGAIHLSILGEVGAGSAPGFELQTSCAQSNSRTLSNCLVHVYRASDITVYVGIRRLLFPNYSQVLG